MRKRVMLKVRINIDFETEEQFWERLNAAKREISGIELIEGVRTVDSSTHDIPDLDFSGVK